MIAAALRRCPAVRLRATGPAATATIWPSLLPPGGPQPSGVWGLIRTTSNNGAPMPSSASPAAPTATPAIGDRGRTAASFDVVVGRGCLGVGAVLCADAWGAALGLGAGEAGFDQAALLWPQRVESGVGDAGRV